MGQRRGRHPGPRWGRLGRVRAVTAYPGGDQDMPMGRWCGLLLVSLLLGPAAAGAEILLPPGFSAEVYVTGRGFDPDTGRASLGIPATSTIAVDQAGLPRAGRRRAAH